MLSANEYKQNHLLSLTEQIKSLQKEKEETERKIAEFNSSVKAGEDVLAELDSNVSLAKEEYKKVLGNLEKDIKDKRIELDSLKYLHSTENEFHSQRIVKSKNKIEMHNSDIEARRKKIIELQNQESSLKLSIKKLGDTQKELVKDTNSAIKEKNESFSDLDKVKKTVSVYKAKLDKLSADIKRIEKTRHVLIEDVLTEREKLLFDRYNKRVEMNKALDIHISNKRKQIKTPWPSSQDEK